MTVCSNCGAEVTRSRIIWSEDGTKREECRHCAPDSFEKFTVPSDKKPWMGWEAHPNEYEKRYDKDGIIYERKPEYRAEQEQKLKESTEEEKQALERATRKKRAERRTAPMTPAELAAATRRAEEIARWIQAAAAEGRDIN
jgi:hypothetical protein